MRLAKAHGLGNDFLLVEAAAAPASSERGAWARRLCDRHRGVGADGVVVFQLERGRVVMRLVNADGSEAEISGNGLRCLAAYACARKAQPARHVVSTLAGDRSVDVADLGANRYRVTTDLGAPILASAAIPVALEPPAAQVLRHTLRAAGRDVVVTATSLGNPHCAVFLETPAEDALLRELGPALESHPFFPRRTNVEMVTVLSREAIRVRLWERGVGYTTASGTGAASAAVASILEGRTDRRLRVECDGGVLEVEWPEGGSVRQVGEVELLFEGDWLLS